MNGGTPLPSALSGVIVQRLVEIDEALLYLVSGAISGMVLKEPLEQTGALTPETAQNTLSVMLETYLNEVVGMIIIGSVVMWMTDTIPDRWLELGGQALSKTTYPELFDIFGYDHGGGFDMFVLPSYRGYSPYGAGADIDVQDRGGDATRVLATGNLPAHNHPIVDPGHDHRVKKQSGTIDAGVNTATPAARTDNPATPHVMTDVSPTGISVGNTGDGNAFSILHPVFAARFIIYAGR